MMIGKIILHYKILEELGAGGMGVVYKAEDTKLERPVALKFLPREFAADQGIKQRFLQEAKTVSSLDHPNICNIYEINESDEGELFIAMAHYEGKTLRSVMNQGSISAENAVNLVLQVADGLKVAHARNIIHRDIKPENILITSDSVAKILDFGLAKSEKNELKTEIGTTVGTSAYKSPEQSKGEEVDRRADIWSLGVIFYEMLFGERPFKGEYDQAVIYSILNLQPVFPDNTDDRLHNIIAKMLEKDPETRYKSAEALIADIKHYSNASSQVKSVEQMASPNRPSIAILPFANLSSDPEQEFFCDGISEEIINSLTNVSGMQVVARTSAFAFKGQNTDIREIGKKLNVAHVVEGSVRKAGNKLRITVQLIKIADGYHLWSEKFDRTMDDIFEIQDEISLAVVEKLKVKLLGGEKTAVKKRATENVEAYNCYLQGLQAIATGVTQNYGNSIECFEKAIALDPEFALAYVGIARVTAFKSLYGRVPPLEGHVKIKEALRKAFELDGDLAEAYAVNGYTIFLFDKDFSLGEENFNTALRLNPNNAFILILYANCLSAARRHDEAIQAGEKAKMLDPLSFYISGQICLYYFRQGTFDKAEQVIKQGLDLQPTYFVYHLLLGLSQLGASKFTEALDSFALAKTYSGGTPMAFYGLGATYQALGDDANMNNAFDAVFQAEAANYVPEVVLAMVYSRKKDTQKGLKYLKKSYENKDLLLLFMIGNQTAFSVTNEPEYCEYLKEVGLWK